MLAWRRCVLALPLLVLSLAGATDACASDATLLAQVQPAPQVTPTPSPSQAPATPATDTQTAAPEEPIGNVATVTGIATVIRDKNSYPLRVRDDIYLNDVVQTASNSSLSIAFNDSTTFNLSASAKITIDNYVYEDGGKQNSAIFDIGKGTVAFVAAAVAKTGDMKITTPTATLGIRGTTGVIDVPANASAATAAANNVNIKLYPDADGRVGHIDVNDRTSGARLGALTQGASGFAIRPGTGGARFAAVPITIAPQQVARDRVFVSQVHQAQTTGRQIVTEQREFRRANPGATPRIPRPVQPAQPQQQPRPNGQPGPQPQRPGGQPGQNNRPGQQQPGAPNRQGKQQPQRQGQGSAGQPGTPRTGQGQQQGAPRTGQTPPGGAINPQAPHSGQAPAGATPQQQTPRAGQQGQSSPPAVQPPQGGVQHQGGLQQRLPGLQRPAPRKPAPPPKEKKERR
ncbi:FecR domain-containing protein [Bradyrhizobium sp. UFLA05-109]